MLDFLLLIATIGMEKLKLKSYVTVESPFFLYLFQTTESKNYDLFYYANPDDVCRPSGR